MTATFFFKKAITGPTGSGGSRMLTYRPRLASRIGFFALAAGVAVLGFGVAAQATTISSPQAYFASDSTNPGSVIPYTLASGLFGTAITVGNYPTQVILSPDGSTAYVLNYDSGTISVIDTATDTVTNTLSLKGLYYGYPNVGVISPDGKTLYITDQYYDAYAINAQTGALEATYTLGASVGKEVYPYNLAIGPTGGHVYVTEYEGGPSDTGALGIIDTSTGAVTTLPLGTLALPGASSTVTFLYPHLGIVVSGDTVWLSGYPYDSADKTYGVGIVGIDTATDQATQFVELETDYSNNTFAPSYLYLDPAGSYLYMPTDTSSYGVAEINTQTGAFQFIPSVADAYVAAFSDTAALYVDGYTSFGTSTVDVIDANPQSAHFGTVVSTITGAPSGVTSLVLPPPPFFSNDQAVTISAPAGPYTGSVAAYVTNKTGCTPTFKVTTPPSGGDFQLNAAGGYSFTPPLGNLPASESFTWEATLPATCANDPNGVAEGTVTLTWTPTFGAIGPFTLVSGQSSGTVSFNVFSSSPVILTASSSDPAVVSAGEIDLSQDCQGTCTLNLTAGEAGASTVTLTATEPSGATSSTTFSVAVAPTSSGGGGGLGPWALLGLLAFVLLKRRPSAA